MSYRSSLFFGGLVVYLLPIGHLIGVFLIGVSLIGASLIGGHLIDASLIGVLLTEAIP
jgi:hypothetical protein